MNKRRSQITPYLVIMLSFLGVILVGTLLFLMPFATKKEFPSLSFIDAYFMATSSVCVTGLSVIANVGETLSIYGKIVMALLIEIGGLSFLTLAVFIVVILGKKVGVSNRYLMKEALNQTSAHGIVKLVKRIIVTSFSIQIVGAFINFWIFKSYYPVGDAIGVSIFHAISSFNNAGFDIFGYDNSMINFSDHILLNINTMVLIILGGIGFIVIHEVIRKRRWKKFSLHTKIVITTTIGLIVFGTLLIFVLSRGEMTFLQSLFQSVSARTAGYATFNMANINNATMVIMIVLMFIGASPCSTGGGLKTTTFFVIIAAIFSFATGKEINAYKRKIANQSVFRAFALVALAIIYITFIVLLISVIEKDWTLSDITFEVVSAFGTVGLSSGGTTNLHWLSKLLLSFTMYFGRLGPLTIISVLNVNWLREENENIAYVEEKIIIG